MIVNQHNSKIQEDLSDIRGGVARYKVFCLIILGEHLLKILLQSMFDAVWSHMIFVCHHFTNICQMVVNECPRINPPHQNGTQSRSQTMDPGSMSTTRL